MLTWLKVIIVNYELQSYLDHETTSDFYRIVSIVAHVGTSLLYIIKEHEY